VLDRKHKSQINKFELIGSLGLAQRLGTMDRVWVPTVGIALEQRVELVEWNPLAQSGLVFRTDSPDPDIFRADREQDRCTERPAAQYGVSIVRVCDHAEGRRAIGFGNLCERCKRDGLFLTGLRQYIGETVVVNQRFRSISDCAQSCLDSGERGHTPSPSAVRNILPLMASVGASLLRNPTAGKSGSCAIDSETPNPCDSASR